MPGLGLNLLSSVCYRAIASFGSLVPTLNLNFTTMTALPSTITFSRPSNATYYDSTGKLTYAPNNLLLQSQSFETASWQKIGTVTANSIAAPDGSMTADTITATNTTSAYVAQQGIPTDATIMASAYFKKGTARYAWVDIYAGTDYIGLFDLNTGTYLNSGGQTAATGNSITDVGGGWYRISIYKTGLTGNYNVGFGFSNSSTNAFSSVVGEYSYLWGSQYEKVTYQTTPGTYNATTSAVYYGARLDYNPATLAARGLLIEEARTNLQIQSQTLDATSFNNLAGLTRVVAGGSTPSSGTGNYTRFTATPGTSNFYAQSVGITLAAGSSYTMSAELSYVSQRWIGLSVFEGGFRNGCTFDLLNGVKGSTAGIMSGYTITSLGGAKYRITATFAATSSGPAYWAFVFLDSDKAFTTLATSTILAATVTDATFAQFELGTFATSYIPTAASSVARSADTASMTGTNFSSWYNATAGAVVVSWTYGMATASIPTYTSAFSMTTSGSARQLMQDLGASAWYDGTIYINTGASVGLVLSKTAFSYENGNNAACLNGGTVVTSSSPLPVTPNEATIGNQTGTSRYVNGWVASIVFYPQRLPNATLQSLTS